MSVNKIVINGTEYDINDARLDLVANQILNEVSDLENKAQMYKGTKLPSDYNNKICNITDEGTHYIGTSFDSWEDLPKEIGSNCVMLINEQYSYNYIIQRLKSFTSDFEIMRVVHKTTHTPYKDWIPTAKRDKIQVVGCGDSICRAERNNRKSYLAYLGFDQYVNLGVNGAPLCGGGTIAGIYTQLENYTVPAQCTAIIAEGGINDVMSSKPWGNDRVAPVTTAAEAAALNKNTVVGGLHYLCYLMVTKFYNQQRYFVITHRALNYPYKDNTAGYNQTDLHDLIVKTCAMYSIQVIDLFNNSTLNTSFEQYISPTAWSADHSAAESYYCDKDGINPMDYGYRNAYASYIRKAIMDAGVNN